MKKNRVIALALCGALVCGIGGAAAAAGTAGSSETGKPETVVTAAAPADTAQGCDETVYVIANADGSAKKVIVSSRFENTPREEAQAAMSGLTGVENVKGDDCWQGTADQELPVQMHISYTLDSKPVTAEELAGKSGHVVIRYEYENRQTALVMVDGRQETLYVPFAVLTGTVLDSDCFSNVTVTNGKLINDGNRMAVAGVSFPGLQKNLALDTDKLEIPDYVEIEADVTSFRLETTLSVVSSSLWNSLDEGTLDELNLGSLGDDLDKLTDAMSQLLDGSQALYEGLDTLLASTGALSDGVTQLAGGLDQLAANNSALNSGARQVFDSLLSMANSQIAAAGLEVPQLTVDNYSEVLGGVLSQLGSAGDYAEGVARDKVEQAVRAQKDTVRAAVLQAVQPEVTGKVTEAVQNVVWQQVLAAANLTQETYDAGVAAGVISAAQQAQLKAALEQQMATEAVKQQIEAAAAEQMASDEVLQLVEAKTEEQIQLLIAQQLSSDEVQQQIGTAKEQAAAGAASLQSLKSQLDSYAAFYNGLTAYTAGVASARDGAETLQGSMPALTDGVSQLCDGARALSEGLKEFNQEGVQKLVEAFDGDLGTLTARLRATADAAQSYQSFAVEHADTDGAVRFVYRTEAIEAQ